VIDVMQIFLKATFAVVGLQGVLPHRITLESLEIATDSLFMATEATPGDGQLQLGDPIVQ
jgi:hypothetical protein